MIVTAFWHEVNGVRYHSRDMGDSLQARASSMAQY